MVYCKHSADCCPSPLPSPKKDIIVCEESGGLAQSVVPRSLRTTDVECRHIMHLLRGKLTVSTWVIWLVEGLDQESTEKSRPKTVQGSGAESGASHRSEPESQQQGATAGAIVKARQ